MSMIDFVVVSSDLRPYVLDTRVKRGAELTTDHHLVVSWIRWQRRKLDRLGRPKRIVRVCWERLAEPSVREVFNSHLRKSFSQIPREAGDIESEWTMFSASIVNAAVRSCGRKVLWCLSWRQPPNPVVDTGSKGCRQAEEGVLFGPCWPVGLLTASHGGGLSVWPRRDSGKPSGASEGGSSTLPTLFTVQVVSCLTSTGDIVAWWKKYFEDLLNPTDLPSSEEAEAGDSEVDSSITQAEVTEVVRKLLRGTGECVPTIQGDHTSQPPREGLHARVLERRIRPIVDPRIQEEQCGFHPGRGTLDQVYTLRRVLEVLWEFAQPVIMCFVDLEKAFDRVPRGILWGVLREYGVRGPLLRAVRSLYDQSRSLVRIAGSNSDLFPVHVGLQQGCPLSVTDYVVLLASSGQDLQHVLEQFAAECEAAAMRISTSKSEAMVLDRKRVACPLLGGWRGPASSGGVQVSRGLVHESEGKMEREIDRRIGAVSAVIRRVPKGQDRRYKQAEMSFLHRVAGRSLKRYGEKLSHSGGARRSRAAAPSHREESTESVCFGCSPGCLPREVFQACPTGRRPRGRPRTWWRHYVSQLKSENASGSPGRAGGSVWVCFVEDNTQYDPD
ncbi:hypothetical protein L3Q82_011336 [Scortum barcoo]|uniref:Uncharacterized protein n=1 Tax=Scortum barcoo TaxID=214431 RepID=A0ACB8W9N3_9TELE|nr:hypothetical protein L3Q82_011336 [Scortum barcoo]